jgi:hypothetical protein
MHDIRHATIWYGDPRKAIVGLIMNRWNIPNWLESAAYERDKACVYCGCSLRGLLTSYYLTLTSFPWPARNCLAWTNCTESSPQ